MAYKALYRTYRPSTFDEVAGQQHIVKTIKNALATGKIAHAYLFAGPRGTGKTTMAKLLAKALNCDEGIGNQCNECKNCKSIIDGTHPDVIELDAASNNGVDEIRELIDKVKYGTILGRYKVYIIDEVHMLSTGAFNALLKTLEEPPEHVIFILATTEPHKILPTILSRCQRYDFSKLSDLEIKERLKTVLEKENIDYVEEAIDLIISLADGGMRDALSILDQVLAYSGNKLNVQDILDIFALESVDEKVNLLTSIANGNIGNVLNKLSRYIAKGTDIRRLTDDLLIILKDILIYQTSHTIEFLEMLDANKASELSRLILNEKTIEMIDVVMGAQKDYKSVTAINSLFEVTLLKLTAIAMKNNPDTNKETVIRKETQPVHTQEDIKQAVFNFEKPAPQPAPVVEEKEEISLFDEAFNNVSNDKNVLKIKGTENENSFIIDDEMMIKIMVLSKKEIKNALIEDWQNLKCLATHPTLGKFATYLVDGRPLVASQKVLILEYQLPINAERINNKANQESIQNVISSIFNKKMFVYAVSRNDSVRLQQTYMNKLQLSMLPKPDNVTLEFEGE